MAELPVFSSQGSHYEHQQILLEQENIGSSPPLDLKEEVFRKNSQKPKKPPTVTPKRFTKFFTPRHTKQQRQSKAGRQLRDITRNGANRRPNTRLPQSQRFAQTEPDDDVRRPSKRQKFCNDIASSPPQSSPLKHVQTAEQIKVFDDVPTSPAFSDDNALSDLFDHMDPFPLPLRRLRDQAGRTQRILQRSFGGFDAITRGRRGQNHCADWLAESANFVSTPLDMHVFSGTALPFCTASCKTNSMIAVGEEEGGVRLIDSSQSADFTKPHIAFRPHQNAIMHIAFNSDDYMLATASGDQTARVIDMYSQQTLCILSGHKSSVKQVTFHSNDDNMITTSSRDGTVMVWDMRCGGKGSVQTLRTSFARNVDLGGAEPAVRYSKHTIDVGAAHRSARAVTARTLSSDGIESGSVSITAIQHLPNGREHLLITTSEIDASIKLWDLRNANRRGVNTPIAAMPVPSTHSKTRHYGINAMALSGDGARLYTVCRDGTVYAYSANHLVLGSAPEMSTHSGKARLLKSSKAGIGPLYGFKHPSLRTGSFYVKAALRPAKGDTSEMLAVGSSNNCAVLFPTDERYLPRRDLAELQDDLTENEEAELPSLPSNAATSPSSGIPMHNHGTALVRGHSKEVTSLTWTNDGELVTVSDDFSVRCWREDGEQARDLRGCGEAGGRRWRCGWADVDLSWDEDDG